MERGHEVTVLTSQYERRLPRHQIMHGVRVVRVPVVARVSKGVLMPAIGVVSTRLVSESAVINVHLPQLDASGIALRGYLLGKPVVLTYHSDLILPRSPVNLIANSVVNASNEVAARLSGVVCAYTEDFARHSRFLSRHQRKLRYILPPVTVSKPSSKAIKMWARRNGLGQEGPVIGVAVRLAEEKGIEYLLEALPAIIEKYPNARVLHAGPVEHVIGERRYYRRLQPLLRQFSGRYKFLGPLEPEEMALFFSNCDVHVLPSINSTETFGLVQIEAALCGTPTVASRLPGVRAATKLTGIGKTVPPRDAGALATAILEVIARRTCAQKVNPDITAQFSPQHVAARYEELFLEMLARQSRNGIPRQ